MMNSYAQQGKAFLKTRKTADRITNASQGKLNISIALKENSSTLIGNLAVMKTKSLVVTGFCLEVHF